MGKPRGHRPKWKPESACLARNITMQDLVRKVALARGPGMQSFEELCETELCGIAPRTLKIYMDENPNSPFSLAITRARPSRTAYVKAKMSQIIDDDEHSYQGRMITWFLERFGGDEFIQTSKVKYTGAPPQERSIPVITPQDVAKALALHAKATKNQKPKT